MAAPAYCDIGDGVGPPQIRIVAPDDDTKWNGFEVCLTGDPVPDFTGAADTYSGAVLSTFDSHGIECVDGNYSPSGAEFDPITVPDFRLGLIHGFLMEFQLVGWDVSNTGATGHIRGVLISFGGGMSPSVDIATPPGGGSGLSSSSEVVTNTPCAGLSTPDAEFGVVICTNSVGGFLDIEVTAGELSGSWHDTGDGLLAGAFLDPDEVFGDDYVAPTTPGTGHLHVQLDATNCGFGPTWQEIIDYVNGVSPDGITAFLNDPSYATVRATALDCALMHGAGEPSGTGSTIVASFGVGV